MAGPYSDLLFCSLLADSSCLECSQLRNDILPSPDWAGYHCVLFPESLCDLQDTGKVLLCTQYSDSLNIEQQSQRKRAGFPACRMQSTKDKKVFSCPYQFLCWSIWLFLALHFLLSAWVQKKRHKLIKKRDISQLTVFPQQLAALLHLYLWLVLRNTPQVKVSLLKKYGERNIKILLNFLEAGKRRKPEVFHFIIRHFVIFSFVCLFE